MSDVPDPPASGSSPDSPGADERISPGELPAPPPTNAAAWWRQQFVLTRKELRETLRDRRTIVTLFAMPLLLYPMLGMIFRLVALTSRREQGREYRVVLAARPEAEWLEQALELGGRWQIAPAPSSPSTEPPSDDSRPRFSFYEATDAGEEAMQQAVATSEAELAVRVYLPTAESGDPRTPQVVRVQLWHSPDNPASRDARAELEQRLLRFNLAYFVEAARARGRPGLPPVETQAEPVRAERRSTGLVGLLPLVLLLMTVTGGVYPAIDLTAGERERDTLETLLALPLSRARLLLAKYAAVLCVILFTGVMNLLAMGATVYTLQLESQLFGTAGLTLPLVGKLLCTLLIFGLFYGAVLLAITSAARSFKEAQAYLIPLMLLSLAPGLVILLPGWRLEGWPSVTPLINMLLLARELIEGTAAPLPAWGALLSTLLYTASALAAAAQWFGADAVAVGGRGSWSDWLQRPRLGTAAPTLATVVGLLAALFPLHFFVSGGLARLLETAPGPRLLAAGILTVVLFALLPALVVRWQRGSLSATWALRPFRPATGIAALVLGASTWPWIYELILGTQDLGLGRLEPEQVEAVQRLLASWEAVPLPWLVLALGVAPGVCEELFFRGLLFAGCRARWGGAATVVATALGFGLFHIVLAGGAAPERFLPSTILGLWLGWVRLRSDSTWPGILLHVSHNSLLLTMTRYRDLLAHGALADTSARHLPATWLAASAVALVVGGSLLAWGTRSPAAGGERSDGADATP
ncbi:MAG: ABC transporter permease subunit [Pirellulales bacterium]